MLRPKATVQYMSIIVHPRVFERHPDLSLPDVEAAVLGAITIRVRLGTDPLEHVGVGLNQAGQLLQWIGNRMPGVESWFIFHAMRATRNVLIELGLK